MGQIRGGVIGGVGLMIFQYTGFVLGYYKEGKLEGFGVVKEPSGNFYFGHFKGGIKEGPFVNFKWETGSVFREFYRFGILKSRINMLKSEIGEELIFRNKNI